MKEMFSDFVAGLFTDSLSVRIGWGIAVFLFIVLIGYIKHRKLMASCLEKQNFLTDYRNQFIEYINNPKKREEYTYLSKHLTKAQRYMGVSGIFEKFKLPFENGYHLNFPVLTLLNQIDLNIQNRCGSTAYEYAQIVENALIRSIGDHEDEIAQIRKRSRNIFVDFHTGFYTLFSLPFSTISYMLTGKDYFNTQSVWNVVIKVIAGIVQFISILSGIVTIAIGWEQFIEFIQTLIH